MKRTRHTAEQSIRKLNTAEQLIEVGAFYWTATAPDIVNPGREEQGSVSVYTAWGVRPPSEL